MNTFKFQLYSDIHLEFYNTFPKIPKLEDNLILAGDIGKLNTVNYKPFFDYCSSSWKKVFYILGNHEYYINKESIEETTNKYKQFFSNYNNIHLLNNSFVTIDNINIYGSTLWTKPTKDFKVMKRYFNDYSKLNYFDVVAPICCQYLMLMRFHKGGCTSSV